MIEFHVNEFAVESEFALPADPLARSPRCIPASDQITLRRASLANIPSTLRKVRRQLVYDVGDGFLIEPEGLALHIDFKGRALTLDCPDEKLAPAVAWAMHIGLGAATVTRGGIPLHGAGLEVAGRYVALLADSGAGKSTLSWFLMQQGALFANDDLIPVRLEGEDALAFPSVSLFPKLQRETVDHCGLNVADLRPADYGTGEEEYWIPLPSVRRILAPAPLAAVFRLRPQMERMSELATARRLSEEEAAQTLQRNLHALWLIGKWVDGRRIQNLCRRMAARVPIYDLTYPRTFALLPDVAATIRRAAEASGTK